MLELARPETRVHGSTTQRFTWGIVDVILAVLMLPFGIAVFVIECMVSAVVAAFSDRPAPSRRQDD
jgi:hypothetical protein